MYLPSKFGEMLSQGHSTLSHLNRNKRVYCQPITLFKLIKDCTILAFFNFRNKDGPPDEVGSIGATELLQNNLKFTTKRYFSLLFLLYVQEVGAWLKILNRSILSNIELVWSNIILLCKQIIFNLKYCNSYFLVQIYKTFFL